MAFAPALRETRPPEKVPYREKFGPYLVKKEFDEEGGGPEIDISKQMVEFEFEIAIDGFTSDGKHGHARVFFNGSEKRRDDLVIWIYPDEDGVYRGTLRVPFEGSLSGVYITVYGSGGGCNNGGVAFWHNGMDLNIAPGKEYKITFAEGKHVSDFPDCASGAPGFLVVQDIGELAPEWESLQGIQAYHFGARMYDPEVGVWLGCDPAGQYWGSYTYCGNSPTMVIDPNGELGWFVWSVGTDGIQIGWQFANGTGFYSNFGWKDGFSYSTGVTAGYDISFGVNLSVGAQLGTTWHSNGNEWTQDASLNAGVGLGGGEGGGVGIGIGGSLNLSYSYSNDTWSSGWGTSVGLSSSSGSFGAGVGAGYGGDFQGNNQWSWNANVNGSAYIDIANDAQQSSDVSARKADRPRELTVMEEEANSRLLAAHKNNPAIEHSINIRSIGFGKVSLNWFSGIYHGNATSVANPYGYHIKYRAHTHTSNTLPSSTDYTNAYRANQYRRTTSSVYVPKTNGGTWLGYTAYGWTKSSGREYLEW